MLVSFGKKELDEIFKVNDANELELKKNEIFNNIQKSQKNKEKLDEEIRKDKSYLENSIFSLLRNKRSDTVQAAEETWTLCIPNSFYFNFLLKKVKIDLDKKLNLLKSLHILKDIKLSDLMFMCNLMIKKKFRLGETILKKDEVPNCIFFISKGLAKIVWIKKVVRKEKPDIPTVGRNQVLKPFLIRQEKKDIDISNENSFQLFSDEIDIFSNYRFNHDPANISNPNKYSYYEHYCLKEIKAGGFIGLRSILNATNEMGDHKINLKPQKANFDIISDSSDLETFIFPKKFYRFLSIELRVRFFI